MTTSAPEQLSEARNIDLETAESITDYAKNDMNLAYELAAICYTYEREEMMNFLIDFLKIIEDQDAE